MFCKRLVSTLLALSLMGMAGAAQANTRINFCVFDIIGTSGDTFNLLRDYRTAALNQGVDLRMRAFTDENIAYEEFLAGQCDLVAMTGLRARNLNSYVGSLDSIGAIPNYDVMRTVAQVLASNNPRITDNMRSGSYEVIGMAPMGAAYLFVKDQSINNVNALAGRSISVLEHDVAQGRMAARVGMSPVMSDITNFAGRFNNHSVDICFAPMMAYSALELYRGMGPDGGIVDYTLGQLTMQLVARHEKLPNGFANWSRQYVFENLHERAQAVVDNSYNDVSDDRWIRINEEDTLRYDEMMREARVDLTQQGVYNADMMSLLRNIRCRHDGSRAECSERLE
ncbi:MAG: hypothetical protein C0462_01215 [Alcanivorax sp.]|nr:hypothetical protein [Alcanivorax sp.]